MLLLNGSTPRIPILMVDATDDETAETGLTVTVQISKNGGSFATTTNSPVEVANGWYYVALTATETNTDGPLLVRATGTGADEYRDYHQIYTNVAANVTQFGGANGTFASGRPEVNSSHWAGTAVGSTTVRADLINIAGAAVSTSSAQLGVNVVNAGGSAIVATSGLLSANVTQFGGTNGTFAGGRAEVNVSHFGGSAGTFSGGRAEVNVSHFGGTAGTFATGIPAVNTVQWRGTQPSVLISGRVDVSVGANQAGVITAAAHAADAIDSTALAASAANKIRDAVDDSVVESQDNITRQQAESIILSAVMGETSGGTFKSPDGVATRAAVTYTGNDRTNITLTPSS